MKLLSKTILLIPLLLAVGSQPTPGQTHFSQLRPPAIDLLSFPPPPPLSGSSLFPSSALIVTNFIDAERKFREALLQFSFQREVVLQTIGADGEVTGEYIRNSVFVLDDRGKRIERVVYHPKSTIKQLKITKEDVQDLAGSQLFGLEPSEMDSYNFSYLGRENFKQRAVHLIAVTPKQEPDPQHMRARFFVGRIWIDADSFQILKLQGTTEPHGKQRFPLFETERGLKIEDQFFPSTTSADQVLRFPHVDIHYRIAVRYYDFKRFAGRVKIVELDQLSEQ